MDGSRIEYKSLAGCPPIAPHDVVDQLGKDLFRLRALPGGLDQIERLVYVFRGPICGTIEKAMMAVAKDILGSDANRFILKRNVVFKALPVPF